MKPIIMKMKYMKWILILLIYKAMKTQIKNILIKIIKY